LLVLGELLHGLANRVGYMPPDGDRSSAGPVDRPDLGLRPGAAVPDELVAGSVAGYRSRPSAIGPADDCELAG
jgi:hypothetical protein